MSVHFVNLSNGLGCGHQPERPHFLRIQSTWCEQKRWEDVLMTVGPDLLYHLATNGEQLIVHDKSEKDRLTRALWQGMKWVVYACERAWGLEPESVIMRGGHNATGYFEGAYDSLSERTVNYLKYFGKYHDNGGPLRWMPCEAMPALVPAVTVPDYPPKEWEHEYKFNKPLKKVKEKKLIPLMAAA